MGFILKFLELSSIVSSYMALGAGIIIAPYMLYEFGSYILIKIEYLFDKVKKGKKHSV